MRKCEGILCVYVYVCMLVYARLLHACMHVLLSVYVGLHVYFYAC